MDYKEKEILDNIVNKLTPRENEIIRKFVNGKSILSAFSGLMAGMIGTAIMIGGINRTNDKISMGVEVHPTMYVDCKSVDIQKGYLMPECLKIRNEDQKDGRQEAYVIIKGKTYAIMDSPKGPELYSVNIDPQTTTLIKSGNSQTLEAKVK